MPQAADTPKFVTEVIMSSGEVLFIALSRDETKKAVTSHQAYAQPGASPFVSLPMLSTDANGGFKIIDAEVRGATMDVLGVEWKYDAFMKRMSPPQEIVDAIRKAHAEQSEPDGTVNIGSPS